VDDLAALAQLVARLRRDCPWDREQTPETLRAFLLEECHETLEAIDAGEAEPLRDELGDLLFQVFFLAEIASERGWFRLGDVARGITQKMTERHPHVFGNETVGDAGEVKRNWETRKRRSSEASRRDPLATVPAGLPALAAAHRMTARAADLGFDWERDSDVARKIEEELSEWRDAREAGDLAEESREIGDMLLSIVNLARRRGIYPEDALRQANARFRRRFAHVSRRAAESGREMNDIPLKELDGYWDEAKDAES
jgi:MazG family protein